MAPVHGGTPPDTGSADRRATVAADAAGSPQAREDERAKSSSAAAMAGAAVNTPTPGIRPEARRGWPTGQRLSAFILIGSAILLILLVVVMLETY